jgi:hypothetical protein
MIVYVESNFILELAYLQEDYSYLIPRTDWPVNGPLFRVCNAFC